MAYPPSTWTTDEIACDGIGAGGCPTPTITTRTPTSGTAAGGTVVTIVGTNFQRNTKVMIGSGTPFVPTSVSPTGITFTTPATGAGATTITACSGPGSATVAYTFT